MKKLFALLLAVIMLLSLAACGEKEITENAENQPEATDNPALVPDPVKITLATGGTSGTYYAVGGVIQTVLSPKLNLCDIVVESTGASVANINMVTDGEAQLAIVQSDIINYAHNGTFSFEGNPETAALWLATICNETVQIVARPGLNSLQDLKGKVVCVGDVGSGSEVNAWQILNSVGITKDDIHAVNGSFTDAVDMLRDGKIDATFSGATPPTTAIVDYATTNELNIISFTEDDIEKVHGAYPFLIKNVIPAGTYNGQNTDVVSVGVQTTLVASEDLSEDVVYEFVKGLYDNQPELAKAHVRFSTLDAESSVTSATVPMHPGAIKYYKEIGLM